VLVWEELHLVTFIKLFLIFIFSFEELTPRKSGKYFLGILQKGQPKGAEEVFGSMSWRPAPPSPLPLLRTLQRAVRSPLSLLMQHPGFTCVGFVC